MLDVSSELRAWLANQTGITDMFGTRIYAGRYLPPGYIPQQGPALLFAPRGGGQDFSSHVLSPSMQFRIYAETEAGAWAASKEIYDAANDQKSRKIIYLRMEEGTFPQILSEPGTDWPYILMYFKANFQN